jgi:hypothetical protein
LDLSGNCFANGKELTQFSNLCTLIIDGNELEDIEDFPVFKHLETFSANKNNLANIDKFLDEAFDRFGNLKSLSLLKNPLNPFFEDEKKYAVYRDRVLDRFPKLKTLDGCAIEFIKKEMVLQKKAEEQKYERLTANAIIE